MVFSFSLELVKLINRCYQVSLFDKIKVEIDASLVDMKRRTGSGRSGRDRRRGRSRRRRRRNGRKKKKKKWTKKRKKKKYQIKID